MVIVSEIPLLDRWQDAWLGQTIRASRWMFPAMESAHLLGLAVLMGSVLIVNLGFFDLGMRRARASRSGTTGAADAGGFVRESGQRIAPVRRRSREVFG